MTVITGQDIEEIVQISLAVCLMWLCIWCVLIEAIDGPYQMLSYFN